MDNVPNTGRVERLAAVLRERHNTELLLWTLERIRMQLETTGPTEDMRAFLDDMFAALDLVEAERRAERARLLSAYEQMESRCLVGAA